MNDRPKNFRAKSLSAKTKALLVYCLEKSLILGTIFIFLPTLMGDISTGADKTQLTKDSKIAGDKMRLVWPNTEISVRSALKRRPFVKKLWL